MTFLFTLIMMTWAFAADPQEIRIPAGVDAELKTFEPSGAVYLPDLDQFLVVIDDTDKKSRPLLYLISRDGQVRDEAFLVAGLSKISDLESVSADGKYVYLLSSLGLTKSGKAKEERSLFVRVLRQGTKFTLDKSVDLRELLIPAIQNSKLPELANLKISVEEELDVESHFIRDGKLYVGLKSPQSQPGTATILDLGSVDKILNAKKIENLQVWKTINFRAISNEDDMLSEILVFKNEIWFATTNEDHHGRFWKFDEKTGKVELKKYFRKQRLEGLAYDVTNKTVFMVFDQSNKPALFNSEPAD